MQTSGPPQQDQQHGQDGQHHQPLNPPVVGLGHGFQVAGSRGGPGVGEGRLLPGRIRGLLQFPHLGFHAGQDFRRFVGKRIVLEDQVEAGHGPGVLAFAGDEHGLGQRMGAGHAARPRAAAEQAALGPGREVAQGVGDAADRVDAVDVQFLGQAAQRGAALLGVELPFERLDQDGQRAALAHREVPLHQLRPLPALPDLRQLLEQVIADPVPVLPAAPAERAHGQQRHHQDQSGPGQDDSAGHLPEPRQPIAAGHQRDARVVRTVGPPPLRHAERPQDDRPRGPQQGRSQRQAGGQGHQQAQRDGRPAVRELAEIGEEHHAQPHDGGHGTGRQGSADRPQGAGNRLGRRSSRAPVLPCSGLPGTGRNPCPTRTGWRR